MAVVSTFLLGAIILGVTMAPSFGYIDSEKTDAANSLLAPSSSHFLGTDDMGRDIFIRILYGGQMSLAVGFFAASVSMVFGILVGGISGYFGGWVDKFFMRVVDLFLSLPTPFLVLVINLLLRESGVSYMRSGILPVSLIIGLTSWMELARLVRSSFLALREREFVEAARALGAKGFWIAYRHIIPNSLNIILVNLTILVSGAILLESGLSYLGFGIQPPTPTWGNMLNRAQNHFYTAPWLAIFPGLMICITVIVINFIGDGLRDALDPQSQT